MGTDDGSSYMGTYDRVLTKVSMMEVVTLQKRDIKIYIFSSTNKYLTKWNVFHDISLTCWSL